MTVALQALPQFFDNSGNPLSGGKVYTYAAGTLTPLSTYTDRGGLTANANPVVLDSAGRADIWLSTNIAYKLIVQDSAGNVMDSVDQFYAGADPSQLTTAGIVPSTGGTYTGLVDFTGGATFSGTATQDLATLNSLGVASVKTHNLWINPDFFINQRAVGSQTDNAYGYDRTVNLCESGSTTLTQLAQPTDGIPFALRITQPDAAPKRIGSLQIVEAVNCLSYRGQQVVFAPKIRCSVATTVRVALVAWTGTQDSPTRDVVNNWASTTYTAGNFFVASTSTIAVGAVALAANTWTDVPVSSASAGGVVVPSTMNNLYMVFWTDAAVAQNVTLDASIMRCGLGTEIPLYTPPDTQQELSRCKRYLPSFRSASINDQVGAGQAASTTVGLINYSLEVEARVAATTIVAGGGYALTTAAGAASAIGALSVAVGGKRNVLLSGTVGAVLVAGNATTMQCTSATGIFYFSNVELGV